MIYTKENLVQEFKNNQTTINQLTAKVQELSRINERILGMLELLEANEKSKVKGKTN